MSFNTFNKYSLGSDALSLISEDSNPKHTKLIVFIYNMIHGKTAKLNVALQSFFARDLKATWYLLLFWKLLRVNQL